MQCAAGGGGAVLREGLLEKRSGGLLQLWKKKRCVLTEEAVLLLPPKQQHHHHHLDHHQDHHQHHPPQQPHQAGVKQLHFSDMKAVQCVERRGRYVYFTVVTAGGREVDFRSPQDAGSWNAEITVRMVQYKNRQAVLAVRSTRHKQQLLGASGGPPGGHPHPGPPGHCKTPRGSAAPDVA